MVGDTIPSHIHKHLLENEKYFHDGYNMGYIRYTNFKKRNWSFLKRKFLCKHHFKRLNQATFSINISYPGSANLIRKKKSKQNFNTTFQSNLFEILFKKYFIIKFLLKKKERKKKQKKETNKKVFFKKKFRKWKAKNVHYKVKVDQSKFDWLVLGRSVGFFDRFLLVWSFCATWTNFKNKELTK